LADDEHTAAGRLAIADFSLGHTVMLFKVANLFDLAPSSLQSR